MIKKRDISGERFVQDWKHVLPLVKEHFSAVRSASQLPVIRAEMLWKPRAGNTGAVLECLLKAGVCVGRKGRESPVSQARFFKTNVVHPQLLGKSQACFTPQEHFYCNCKELEIPTWKYSRVNCKRKPIMWPNPWLDRRTSAVQTFTGNPNIQRKPSMSRKKWSCWHSL